MRSTKRIIAVAIATGLAGTATAIPASALAPPPVHKPGVYRLIASRVTADGVNSRSGPSTKFKVAGVHKPGSLLAASGRNSQGWSEVFLSTGGSAWLPSAYLTKGSGTVYKVQGQPGVNIRSGPDAKKFRQVGFLKNGVIVPGTGNAKYKWAQLLLSDGRLVWASTRYLVLMNETLTAPATNTPPANDAPKDSPKVKDTDKRPATRTPPPAEEPAGPPH
ncbi:SH3 domain-containing protein [Actinomadura rudentiformis]|uniref:SH3 domain-containing protein n=1 Tax=Actinomadura rudentiformis TaxID=359158 RepID=A0A6H9Z7Z7_9ACTN|nr:SH3 domain-containing protein [Actinomadura rudentiformis]KAB2351366.1 SH3 domain-containing protein [Actinomadura rudentiformis]